MTCHPQPIIIVNINVQQGLWLVQETNGSQTFSILNSLSRYLLQQQKPEDH